MRVSRPTKTRVTLEFGVELGLEVYAPELS
jgi:hypothetical protein